MNILLIIYIAVFGMMIASFFSMLEYRIKTKKKGIFAGRSVCPHCNKVLKAIHLVPVLGYVIQRGKCEHCKERIAHKYLTLELSTAAIFAFIASHHLKVPEFQSSSQLEYIASIASINTHLWVILFGVSSLLFLAYYDILHGIILDRVAIPTMIILGLLIEYNLFVTWQTAGGGFAIAVGFFLAQLLISKGKWIGGGDLRIGGIMGLLLGLKLTVIGLFASYAIGAIISIPQIIKGNTKVQVPFAPYLAAGTIVAICYGEKIAHWYLGLI